MRVPRSRGAISGIALVLLGLWGGFVPFIGPYLGLSIGPDDPWTWTDARLWLSILPAVAVVLGGWTALTATNRRHGAFGAWLALIGGVWFVAGPSVSALWNDGVSDAGTIHGSTGVRVVAELSYFLALGTLVTFFAALALGRFSMRAARDDALQEAEVRQVLTTAPQMPATAVTPAEPAVPATTENGSVTRRAPMARRRRPGLAARLRRRTRA